MPVVGKAKRPYMRRSHAMTGLLPFPLPPSRPTTLTVYFDMDGVLVDWTAGIARLFGLDLAEARAANADRQIQDLVGCSKDKMWARVEAAGTEFWENLEEFPDSMALLREVQGLGIDVALLTSPTWAPNCYAGKAQWAQDRFGKRFDGLVIAREKWRLAGPGRILMDDAPKKCKNFVSHPKATPGGRSILVPRWGVDREPSWAKLRAWIT